jgi:hypothetical protein
MTFDQMWLGRKFAPLDFAIDSAMVAEYRHVFGGLGTRAPVGLISIFARRSYLTEGDMPSGGVMATLRIELEGPLPVGVTLQMQGEVTKHEERNGRKWVTVQSQIRDRKRVVGLTTIVGIWPR